MCLGFFTPPSRKKTDKRPHCPAVRQPPVRCGLPAYSVARNQFCTRSPSIRENSLSLSVTITQPSARA